jgi:YhcH/YjgK/YiaL family protein
VSDPSALAAATPGRRYACGNRHALDAARRHDLDGDRLFALVQEYTTRAAEQCVWEAHRRYIDVQFMAVGAERMGYAPLATMREREPYDAARDVAFFEPGTEFVTIQEGMFAIFGPEDVTRQVTLPARQRSCARSS